MKKTERLEIRLTKEEKEFLLSKGNITKYLMNLVEEDKKRGNNNDK